MNAETGAAPTMDVQAQPGVGIKPLLSLRRHYRIGLLLGLLVFLLGLPVVWLKGQSRYAAEAVFQVSPRYMKNLESDQEVEMQSNSQYREFVNHLSSTVTRYDVLQKALADLRQRGLDPRPPALSEREYIERLQKRVYVRAMLDTYMVRVGTEGGKDSRPHLHELINAIMNAFLETTKVEQIYGSSERHVMLESQAAQLRDKISGMQAERITLGERLGLTTFTENVSNPYDQLLLDTRARLAQAEIDRTRAEADVRAFTEQKEIPAEMGRSLLELRLSDAGLQVLRTEVTRRQEALTQQLAGLAEKHPARSGAEAEMRELNQRLQSRERDFDLHAYDNFLHRLKGTLTQKREVEESLRKALAQLEGQSADYARMFQQAIFLTREIGERETRLKQIQDRLNFLLTESNALGFVRLVTPALPAITPMGVGKTKLLLVVMLAALGAAAAAPIALDMLDRRIRSVTEAEKLMGMPAAGWQIRREDLPTRLFAEEQTRRFASALIRVRARNGRRCFAFTAVKSGGGTTSTILDSALALERLGARVLVVEANTFAPFAGFDGLGPGLSEHLAEGVAPADIRHAWRWDEASLRVVPIGHARATGLQRLDRLRQLLEQWSAEYDFLLFDLPPVLLSADVELLIELLGQVFLVVEGEAVTRGEVARARRLLQKLDPEAVGLFVNRVPLFRGSGYMEEVIVETLTRGKFGRFMQGGGWRLQWALLQTRFSSWQAGRRRGRRAPVVDVPGTARTGGESGVADAPATGVTPGAPQGSQTLPDPLVELNNRAVLAARAGRLEEAAATLCELATLHPGMAFNVNAAKAVFALLARQGWDEALAARAEAFLRQAEALDACDARLIQARQLQARAWQKQQAVVPAKGS